MCNKHYNTANMYRYVRTGCNQDNWCKTDMINSLFYNTNSIFENSNFCNTYNIQGYNDPFYDNKGNCKMGAMIGYGIFSWAIQAFSPLIRNKMAEKIYTPKEPTPTHSDDVKDLNTKIATSLKQLGDKVTEENYNSVPVAKKFEDAIKEAETKVNDINEKIGKLIEPQEPTDDSSNAEKTDYNNAIIAYQKSKDELESQLEKAEQKLKAAKKAKTDEETRIKNLKDEIGKNIERRNEAQRLANIDILDKCDGKKRQQNLQVENKFEIENATYTLNDGVHIDTKDLRGAIALYKQALINNDDEKQKKYAKIFNACLEKCPLDEESKEYNDIMTARGIIPMDKELS